MKINLPETLPLHISTRGSHTYEQAMENREGSHAAMTKAWAVMRDLLIADAGLRDRVAALAVDRDVRSAITIKKRGYKS